MRDIERRRFDRNERQAAFMADNAADFPAASPGGQLAKLMNDDIVLVRQFAADQVGNPNERARHIDEKEDALADLSEFLKMLDLAGDALADDVPGIENLFGLPRNRSEQSLLAAARAQYDISEQYETQLIEYDLPVKFRAEMLELLDKIDAANQSADIAGTRGTGATGALGNAVQRLNRNSKKLDATVRLKYRSDPARLAAWLRANHLEREPRASPPPTGDK